MGKSSLTGDQLMTRVLWVVGLVVAGVLLLLFDHASMPQRTEGEWLVIIGGIVAFASWIAYLVGKSVGRNQRDD